MTDKRPPRQGYSILNEEGAVIGIVTSGTKGPSVGKAIGLGYVEKAYSKSGTTIYIDVRGKKLEATTKKLPFYQVS